MRTRHKFSLVQIESSMLPIPAYRGPDVGYQKCVVLILDWFAAQRRVLIVAESEIFRSYPPLCAQWLACWAAY